LPPSAVCRACGLSETENPRRSGTQKLAIVYHPIVIMT
jgi:hypothetical protein